MKKQVTKKFLSALMTAVMLLSVVPLGGLAGLDLFTTTASAAYENTYTNTGYQRADIIGVAKTQLGYTEGSNNYTKYGAWYGIPNGSWCAMFVSWCARQAEIPTSILKNSSRAGHAPAFFDVKYYAGGSQGKNWSETSQTYGKWGGNYYTPKSGDLFFTTSWSHVGLVYYVDGEYFYTIEGNSNNTGSSEGTCVCTNRRKISDYYFGVPEYTSSHTTIPGPVINLRSDKKVYNTSESIHFIWDAAYGAEVYWVYLWKDGTQLFAYNCGNNTSFTQAPSIPGNYTLIIRPGNYAGFNESSPSYSFTITEEVPNPVENLRSEKTLYTSSESISFIWDAAYGAEEYWVYLWKDGIQLFSYNCGDNTSFTQAPSTPGSYSLIIRPRNVNGFNDSSKKCDFIINDGFIISYNANGGVNAPSTQIKTYGKDIELSSVIPERTGYQFVGWSTNSSTTSVDYYAGDLYTNNSDITLYAKWEVLHRFTELQHDEAYHWYRCYFCDEISGKSPHTGEWTVIKSATCTADGTQTRTCSSCNYSETKTIAKTGHTVVTDPAVAATCTATGKTQGSHCSKCNTVITAQQTISATGHNFGAWTVKTPATATKEGVEERTCHCGAKETRAIPKLGSDKVVSVKLNANNVDTNYNRSFKLTPSVEVVGNPDYKVAYSSSNTGIATVDANGNVNTVGKGLATITVTVTDSLGNVVKDTCNVNVTFTFAQWLLYIICFGWIWM